MIVLLSIPMLMCVSCSKHCVCVCARVRQCIMHLQSVHAAQYTGKYSMCTANNIHTSGTWNKPIGKFAGSLTLISLPPFNRSRFAHVPCTHVGILSLPPFIHSGLTHIPPSYVVVMLSLRLNPPFQWHAHISQHRLPGIKLRLFIRRSEVSGVHIVVKSRLANTSTGRCARTTLSSSSEKIKNESVTWRWVPLSNINNKQW